MPGRLQNCNMAAKISRAARNETAVYVTFSRKEKKNDVGKMARNVSSSCTCINEESSEGLTQHTSSSRKALHYSLKTTGTRPIFPLYIWLSSVSLRAEEDPVIL